MTNERRSVGQSRQRIFLADELLPRVPVGDGLHFFRGQRREQQMRIFSLPREGFRFLDGEAKPVFRHRQRIFEIVQQIGFEPLELRR